MSEKNPLEWQLDEKEINNDELFKEKLFSAWGSARDQLGVPNNYHFAEILYDALYNPGKIKEEDVMDRPGFDRKKYLMNIIDLGEHIIPNKEEFILVIKRAMTSGTKSNECLYDGAKDALREMAEYGPIKIWTRGDVYGISDKKSGKFYPGSKEQIKKSAVAGIGDLRREIAEKKGLSRKEVVEVVASEDKLPSIPSILEEYEEKGITKVFLLDDQLGNIQKAIKEGKKNENIEIIPIWVRQGIAKNKIPKNSEKTLEEFIVKYNGVDSIKNVVEKLESLGVSREEKVGFICDYDEVLASDEKRKEAQSDAVKSILKEKGWASI
ncbi:MAG: hypothetical protein M0P97_02550 [Candidatus Moranbacteria bacterium]|jgi:hypothetical protein|nr:hypothetical protein [Candidatus Moranbacteria bacterium]